MEFVSFEDQMVDLSQLQDSSPIGEIHEIEAFQKVGGANTDGFITANGRYIIEKPFGGEDDHLYRRDLESGDRVLIDADANGIPSTGDSGKL